MSNDKRMLAAERDRIRTTFEKRGHEKSSMRYAPWQPSVIFSRAERQRVAAELLRKCNAFPSQTDPCLEVGVGSIGWLGELVVWGVKESCLHGIDVNPSRIRRAAELLPRANLCIGDGDNLPWRSDVFALVIASTLFTSVLDDDKRMEIASEATRVLRPGGALLWYDFAVNNFRNRGVRKVTRRDLRRLFPTLRGTIRSVTLAPPLARIIAPRSWLLATMLQSVPLLRTHLLAVMIKPSRDPQFRNPSELGAQAAGE